jgi:hypothetical protein
MSSAAAVPGERELFLKCMSIGWGLVRRLD